MEKNISSAIQDITAIRENISRVIVGKNDKITLLLIAFLCRGHVLINDVPGLGKTIMAKSFAKSLGADFKRIQCITGSSSL